MTPEATVSIALLFSIVAVISQISTVWRNHRKAEADSESDRIEIEKNFVKLNMKLDHLTETIQTLLDDDKRRGKELEEIRLEVSNHEERIKQLESR